MRRLLGSWCLLGGMVVTLLAATPSGAQLQIRERPPGELAVIQRRDPDFRSVRFLGLQRSYRDELRNKLLMGHAAIRVGRPLTPMVPIVWPPDTRE